MDLYILRHAIAVPHGTPGYTSDADRPLTGEGKRKLRQIVKAIQRLELSFDLILSSPYLRTAETAKIVAQAFKAKKLLNYTDTLTPEGSPGRLIEFINQAKPPPKSVLLVGHEPYLSRLISLLLTGHTDLSLELKKGGLCKLTADTLKPNRCATLHWLLTPKQMAMMK